MNNNTNHKLSIIIPCYNEKETVKKIIDQINQINLGPIEKEVIIVDDYSTDGTQDILKNLKLKKNHMILYNLKNYGKGYCIRHALSHCTGTIIIIQDADLVFKADTLKSLSLHENRFGFCSEVTAQLLKKKIGIHEVPISYNPRKKHEGKKIGVKDACRAIYVLLKYRFFIKNQ